MTLDQIATFINTGGVVFLLLAVLYGGYKGMWVYGRVYQSKADECETWKTMAMRGVSAAEKVATVADTLTKNGTK